MEENENKFYYPFCRNPNCDGVLEIKINDNYFSLDYECDKNEEHNGHNIYFKTFERFYLKEMKKDKCNNCNFALENTLKYQCKSCGEKFCSSCFIFHTHFKQDINNILIISTKCKNHNANLIHYCKNCKKYLCNYCIKNDDVKHIKKARENLYELMPSKVQFAKIKNRIKEYEDLINDIDIWLKEFNKKILKLKQNIIDEKELISKLILNFNQSFINYSYFKNISYLNDYIKYFNNEYLDKYSKSSTFVEKSKILIDYIINEDKILHKEDSKIDLFDIILEDSNILNNGIIIKITDDHFFKYSNEDKKVQLVKYEVNNLDKIVEKIKVEQKFRDSIYGVTVHNNLDNIHNIYACLNNHKKVAIFTFDSKNHIFGKHKITIIKMGSGYFKKAIQLSNDLVATFDNDNEIDIWTKDQEKDGRYTHLNNISSFDDITDILSVNSEFFISSHYDDEKIKFYDIESLTIKKTLNKVDCVSTKDSLLLLDDQYIIINCRKGFALIYIKTKELVQYIEDYINNYKIKEFIKDIGNNIIIMYINNNHPEYYSENSEDEIVVFHKEINIFDTRFNGQFFQILANWSNNVETTETLHLTCMSKYLMLWDKKVYLLK